MWKELDSLPAGLLEYAAEELLEVLEAPTLIHLQGRDRRPLFVSVLLHGNETVGWEAVRLLLRRYQPGGGRLPLPRSLSLFIGNVSAAASGVRLLPGQPDYNRIWPGCSEQQAEQELPEMQMARDIVQVMADRGVFASVDVHNNTGLNPHYACVNVIDSAALHLATLFGRTVVYFTDPCNVTSMAMAALCPSVTLECGKVGSTQGITHAVEYLDACLHLNSLDGHVINPQDVDVFHTVARVKVAPDCSFEFAGAEEAVSAELLFSRDIERLNFTEVDSGSYFASFNGGGQMPLQIYRDHRLIPSEEYFQQVDQDIVFASAVMPSMLTTNKAVVRQDCLCYLMERYPLSHRIKQD